MTYACYLEVIEIHHDFLTIVLVQHRNRGATRNDGLNIAPSTSDTAAVFLNELFKWDTHLLLDDNWVVDMAWYSEQLCACVM